jgi:hypothetical protein
MASLLIRISDDAVEIELGDLDDETLTEILVTIDESLERRNGIWVHSQDFEGHGQPNRMLWASADQLDIQASFDEETPTPAKALTPPLRETTSQTPATTTETPASGGLFTR